MIDRLPIRSLLAVYLILLIGCGDSNPSEQALELENVCGFERLHEQTTKIVGGRSCSSSNGTVVKILLFDEEENQTVCSGVRLSPTAILTAAHCFNEFVFSALVELGSGERVIPTRILLHPEAAERGGLFINDLALLTISPPSGDVAPPFVPIAKQIATGDRLTILGYGVNSSVNPTSSGQLRIGEVLVAEVSKDSIFSDYNSPTQSNTCFGDSGGPAFIEDDLGGLALAGITSTGTNVMCALGDRSAFTNLTNQALRDFVEKGI
jgi:hypothetical protein